MPYPPLIYGEVQMLIHETGSRVWQNGIRVSLRQSLKQDCWTNLAKIPYSHPKKWFLWYNTNFRVPLIELRLSFFIFKTSYFSSINSVPQYIRKRYAFSGLLINLLLLCFFFFFSSDSYLVSFEYLLFRFINHIYAEF